VGRDRLEHIEHRIQIKNALLPPEHHEDHAVDNFMLFGKENHEDRQAECRRYGSRCVPFDIVLRIRLDIFDQAVAQMRLLREFLRRHLRGKPPKLKVVQGH